MKKFKFNIQGRSYDVDVINVEGNIIQLEVNGTHYDVEMEKEVKTTKTPTLVRSEVPPPTRKETKIPKALTKTSNVLVKSPLPGIIVKITVRVGDTVKIGDKLLEMEAMKMENSVLAEKDGVIKSINVREGDSVLQNDVLMEIE